MKAFSKILKEAILAHNDIINTLRASISTVDEIQKTSNPFKSLNTLDNLSYITNLDTLNDKIKISNQKKSNLSIKGVP